MKFTEQEAEALVRLANNAEFKVVFNALTTLHAKLINALLVCPIDELPTRQGQAQSIASLIDALDNGMNSKTKGRRP